MKFRYFLGFSVSLELTLGDCCLDQANSASLDHCYGDIASLWAKGNRGQKGSNSTFSKQMVQTNN